MIADNEINVYVMPLGSLGEDWILPKLLEAYLTFRAYLSRFIFLLCAHTLYMMILYVRFFAI